MVTLDSDGLIVLNITDDKSQVIKVEATKGDVTATDTFSLTGLVLAPEQEG